MKTEATEGLKENRSVRQRPDEGYRRWFVSAYFELIVWYEAQGGALVGFQLCLSRNHFERAFTWTKHYVSSHRVSESYVEAGMSNQSTGILKGDGSTISEAEVQRFREESKDLDSDLRALILEKVEAYNLSRAGEDSSDQEPRLLS